jgi:hypothetical protein
VIADVKPYPAMKDSGVPWLGEVPEHWDVRRMKSAMNNVIQQTAERRRAAGGGRAKYDQKRDQTALWLIHP